MKKLVFILLVFLLACKVQKPPVIISKVPPAVITQDAVNYKYQPNFGKPELVNQIKISGSVVEKGNAELTEIGILYSGLNVNLVMGADNVNKVTFEPSLGTMYWIVDTHAGSYFHSRAYAINKHGISYGRISSIVTCQRPVGLLRYGLYYRLEFEGGKIFNFYTSLSDIQTACRKVAAENQFPAFNMIGYTVYTHSISVGSPVYLNPNNSCDTLVDGYYIFNNFIPLKIIEIKSGVIINITEWQ